MDRTTREEWAARIARWKDSGLTAAEFASEIGVRARTLSWWKWRLSSKKQESPKGARRAAGSLGKATRISPLTFVEMTAIDTDRLEVVLASSVRIRVRPGFDSTTLGRLLEVLEPKR
jgi:hypothetical protein